MDAKPFTTVLLFGVATFENQSSRNWQRSAEQYGVETVLVATGQKWRGFRWALEQLLTEIEKWSDRENVLFVTTDVFDVLVQSSPSQIIEKYQASVNNYRTVYETQEQSGPTLVKNPLLVTLETGCAWPSCAPFTAKTLKQDRKYVNSGVWAGPFAEVVSMLRWCIDYAGSEDDQVALGRYIDTHKANIAADLYSEFAIVPVGFGQTEYDALNVSSDGVVCENDVCPAFVHLPGLNNLHHPWKMQFYNKVAQRRDLDKLSHDLRGEINKIIILCWNNVFYICAAILCLVLAITLVVFLIQKLYRKRNAEKNLKTDDANDNRNI